MKRWLPQQQVTREQASPAFMEYLASLERELAALQAKLDAIAAVTAPAGGATIDSQSRAAITAIIAAAN